MQWQEAVPIAIGSRQFRVQLWRSNPFVKKCTVKFLEYNGKKRNHIMMQL
jgi:hypothetical protein